MKYRKDKNVPDCERISTTPLSLLAQCRSVKRRDRWTDAQNHYYIIACS